MKNKMMQTTVIEHNEVLDNIYVFLLEHGYTHTLRTLQLESRRAYPVIKTSNEENRQQPVTQSSSTVTAPKLSREGFQSSIHEGRWDEVLSKYLTYSVLPQGTTFVLYEHILTEMLDVFGVESAARTFFMHSPVFQLMKRKSPAQHARLSDALASFKQRRQPSSDPSLPLSVPTAFVEKRKALASELLSVIQFKSAKELHDLDRLPWALAYTSASASSPKKISALTHAHDDHGADCAASQPPLKARRLESSPPLAAATATVMEDRVRVASELPSHVATFPSATHPFEKEGETVSCCHSVRLQGGKSSGTACLVLLGTSLGTLSLLHVEGGEVVTYEQVSSFLNGGVLCITSDVARTTTATSPAAGLWSVVGYRGGCLRVYDCDMRKLARKFDSLDRLGVQDAFFCGPRGAIRDHRGYIIAAGLEGNILLLSIEQGAVIHRVNSASTAGRRDEMDGWGYLIGMTRCCVSSSSSDGPVAGSHHKLEEVFVTVGEDNNVRRWELKKSLDGSGLIEISGVRSAEGSRQQQLWPMHYLHSSLRNTTASCIGGHRSPHAVEDWSAEEARNHSWFGLASRCGKFVVFSMKLLVPLVFCDLNGPITSIDGSLAAAQMFVAGGEGRIHVFAVSEKGKHVQREHPDASSVAVAQVVGGAVEDLKVTATGENGDGSYVAYSSTCKQAYIVGWKNLEGAHKSL